MQEDIKSKIFNKVEFYFASEINEENLKKIYDSYLVLTKTKNAKDTKLEEFGRGVVSKIELSFGRFVMRLYRRGGFLTAFNKASFFSVSLKKTRALRELQVLFKLYNAGIKVPRPLLAILEPKILGIYQAAIITYEISHAKNFLTLINEGLDFQTLVTCAYHTGKEARKSLECGVLHVDLHPGNVLISQNQCYIIDFDKAKFISQNKIKQSQDFLVSRWHRAISKRVNHKALANELNNAFIKGVLSE